MGLRVKVSIKSTTEKYGSLLHRGCRGYPLGIPNKKKKKFKRVSVQWTMVRDTRQFLSFHSLALIILILFLCSYAHMNKQDAINSAKKRGLGKGGGGGKVLIKYFFQVFNMLYPS